MKKICLLTTCIALITTTAFAVPQTNIKKGQTAVDISISAPKDTFSGESIASKANPDFGITTGISDTYAIQYKYHGLSTATANDPDISDQADITMQEFNLIYKINPKTNIFIGINKFSGKNYLSIVNTDVSADFESKNKIQAGITATSSINEKTSYWGTLAAGSDLLNCELGIGQALDKNTDLNLYYRYIRENGAHRVDTRNTFDFISSGFGLGLTLKF